MVPFLIDLASLFDPRAERTYEPAELVRLALTLGNYWAGLGLNLLAQGAGAAALIDDLKAFETEASRPQAQRHQARRLWQGVT